MRQGTVLCLIKTIPNRKSAPVIDEWFALLFQEGQFIKELSMLDVMAMTKLSSGDLPNRNIITQEMQQEATGLLPLAVGKAKEIMRRHCEAYNERINPQIDEELDKPSRVAPVQKRVPV